MNLRSKLFEVADLWVAASRRTDETVSLKTLAVRASQNSKLFERPRMSLPAFEAIVAWLADPTNWPGGYITPDAALILLDWGVSIADGRIADLPAAA